jgi:hypothetical protein
MPMSEDPSETITSSIVHWEEALVPERSPTGTRRLRWLKRSCEKSSCGSTSGAWTAHYQGLPHPSSQHSIQGSDILNSLSVTWRHEHQRAWRAACWNSSNLVANSLARFWQTFTETTITSSHIRLAEFLFRLSQLIEDLPLSPRQRKAGNIMPSTANPMKTERLWESSPPTLHPAQWNDIGHGLPPLRLFS